MRAIPDNLRGAAIMAGSMAAFTLNDALMKGLAGELPLAQALFLRGLSTTALMLAMARMAGGLVWRLPRRDWGLLALRNLAEIGMAYCFVTALFNMPLANATAILQAVPLTVTLAAALFLGEAVGWRRWSAILVGLAGVLLIVRPGAEGFNAYSLYALAAVAMVTARDLLSRRLSAAVPSYTAAFLNAVVVTAAFGVGSAFIDWAPVAPEAWLRLGAASVFLIGGYLFAVQAVRVGELSVVAPFRYTSLLWGLALGALMFGERPSALTLVGAAVVVASGIYTFYRERAGGPAQAARIR